MTGHTKNGVSLNLLDAISEGNIINPLCHLKINQIQDFNDTGWDILKIEFLRQLHLFLSSFVLVFKHKMNIRFALLDLLAVKCAQSEDKFLGCKVNFKWDSPFNAEKTY